MGHGCWGFFWSFFSQSLKRRSSSSLNCACEREQLQSFGAFLQIDDVHGMSVSEFETPSIAAARYLFGGFSSPAVRAASEARRR